MWFWEYTIKIWNEMEEKFEENSGLTTGITFTEAIANIESYYGKNIEEIHMLKPLIEGSVFDFEYAKDLDVNFDFSIIDKRLKMKRKEA